MIAPGPFAPTVTQHIPAAPTSNDRYNDPVLGTFVDRRVRALADYPGGAGSGRANSTEADDILTANRVLLLDPSIPVSSADEFTASDGRRYRVEGEPGTFRSPLTGTAVTQVILRLVTTST